MATGQLPGTNKAGMGELFARLRFVLMAIIVYRIGTHIPVPGIDPAHHRFAESATTVAVTTSGSLGCTSAVCCTSSIHGGRPTAATLFCAPGVPPSSSDACQLRGIELSWSGSISSSDAPPPLAERGEALAASICG